MNLSEGRVSVQTDFAELPEALTWKNDLGEVMFTDQYEGMFPGKYMYILQDEMGLPMDFSLDLILSKGLKVEWPSFIEEARSRGRWDFQIYDALRYLAQDLGKEYEEYFAGVIDRFKLYVLKFPHPAMK